MAVAQLLRDDPELRFDHLANLTAVDWSQYPGYTGKERFTTVYHLVSTASGQRITLKVPASGGDSPAVPTLTGLWPGANWPEREVYDLMGIKFDGHPDLRRILMPLRLAESPAAQGCAARRRAGAVLDDLGGRGVRSPSASRSSKPRPCRRCRPSRPTPTST